MTGEAYMHPGEDADGIVVNRIRINRALIEAAALLILLETEQTDGGESPSPNY